MEQRPNETHQQYLLRAEKELRDRLAQLEIRENLTRPSDPVWPYILGTIMVAVFIAVAIFIYITRGA